MFTAKQLQAIQQALSIAADVYDEDEETSRLAGQPLVARQFRDQAKEARDLADLIAQQVG